jgi:saccharopine dehydrogenase-like NADP-dependent oxidoreductase
MSREGMRVVALGGCGGMGQFAVRTALTFDFVDQIVIADRDGKRARLFAERCGAKAGSVELDIEDSDGLARVLEGADVVLATVGPYYRFGVPILRAAIEAGCNYIDINDDWEPTLEMLEFNGEARKAGITAIIGMGASPGLSNMLAVKAMSLLDTVEELVTGWGIGTEGLRGARGESAPGQGGSFGAAIEHWVHQLTGQIRVFRDGGFVDVSPLQEVKVDYPGAGVVTTHTVGHPEPITLPLHRPELRDSCNVMDMPSALIALLRALARDVDAGRMSVSDAADLLTGMLERNWKGLILSRRGAQLVLGVLWESLSRKTHLPEVFATAVGTRGGKRTTMGVSLSALPPGGMGGATGVPMAVALSMLARGLIDRRGAFAPEGGIDPDAFFDELAPLCRPARADHKDLLVVTTSP